MTTKKQTPKTQVKKTAPKKVAAKKVVTKKAVAKKAVAKKTVAKKESPTKPTANISVKEATRIAEEILSAENTRWNTGRDRDELLKAAGHDPEEVRKEVTRIRGERLLADQE